jgi:hypothetical protein
LSQSRQNVHIFYPKNCYKALRNMSWAGIGGLGSGKNLFRITDADPGIKKHWIRSLLVRIILVSLLIRSV